MALGMALIGGRRAVGDAGAGARPLLGRPGRAVLHRRRRAPPSPSSRSRSPALAGIGEREAGLASGLLNTAQQLGGAIGVAIASTVATSHSTTLLHEGGTGVAALTGGFQWALWVCGAIALLALPVTFLLVRRDELATAVERTTIREPQAVAAGAE